MCRTIAKHAALLALAIPVAAWANDETQLGATVQTMEIEKSIPPGNLSLKNASASKIASRRDLVVMGTNPRFTVAAKAYCKQGATLTGMQVFLGKVVANGTEVIPFASGGQSAKYTDIAGQMGARIDIPVDLKVTRRAGNSLVDFTFNPAREFEKKLAAYVAKGNTAAEYLRETQAYDMAVTVSLVAWCKMGPDNSVLAGKTYPGVVSRQVAVTILYNGDPAIVEGPAPRAATTTRGANGGPPAKTN
jgi:hypothetical protein